MGGRGFVWVWDGMGWDGVLDWQRSFGEMIPSFYGWAHGMAWHLFSFSSKFFNNSMSKQSTWCIRSLNSQVSLYSLPSTICQPILSKHTLPFPTPSTPQSQPPSSKLPRPPPSHSPDPSSPLPKLPHASAPQRLP